MSVNMFIKPLQICFMSIGLCLLLADAVDHRALAISYTRIVETPAMTPRQGSTIKGIVTFPGMIPVQQDSVSPRLGFCGEKPVETDLSVNQSTHGVKDVIVHIGQIDHPVEFDTAHPIVMTNKDCAFQARLSTLSVGQSLEIFNGDPIVHNMHVRNGPRTVMNLVLVPEVPPIVKEVQNPGILKVQCAIHEFMEGFIGVFHHPYHSITNDMGDFQIGTVPPGEYDLVIWHEVLGTLKKKVMVPADEQSIVVNFEFSAPMNPDRRPIILTQ